MSSVKHQVEKFLTRLITIKPKSSDNPPASKPQTTPPQTKPELNADSANTETADSEESEAGRNAESPATPQVDPSENSLAAAIQAKSKDLKPTEVEKN